MTPWWLSGQDVGFVTERSRVQLPANPLRSNNSGQVVHTIRACVGARGLVVGVDSLYPVYTMKLARRAGSSSARRASSSSARRAGLMSWLSGHLNGVILQTFTKLLDERSSSQLVEPASSCKRGIILTGRRVNVLFSTDENLHLFRPGPLKVNA